MPSDICFDCGKLSKFLVAYPELEASVEANQVTTGPTNSCYTNSHKRYMRLRRERKLEYRANKLLAKSNATSWQFDLDGRLRDEEVHDIFELPAQDITDSQEYFGIQTEDIHVYYDIWEDLAQDELALLDDDLNLHYLGRDLMASLDMAADNRFEAALLDDDLNLYYLDHNLMESLDMAADNRFEAALLDDDLNLYYLGHNLMESLDMAAENQFEANDADDEDSEYGDPDGSFAPNNIIVKMAQRCTTLQWEASLPVERISRKAQGLYNNLCEWNFADATSCARSGAALVEDAEISPLASVRKFSFDDGCEELDRRALERVDGDGYCSDSSSATVRNQLVECRRVVDGQAYEWDILL